MLGLISKVRDKGQWAVRWKNYSEEIEGIILRSWDFKNNWILMMMSNMDLQEDKTVLAYIKDIKDRNNIIYLISFSDSEKKRIIFDFQITSPRQFSILSQRQEDIKTNRYTTSVT